MNRLQRLIRDYLDSHPGETLTSIAKRGGVPKSTVQNIASTEQRRQTPYPDTIKGLAKGLGLSFEEVKAAAGDAAGYGASTGERDRLLVELEEYAAPLTEDRRRELIALAKFLLQQERAQASGGDRSRKPRK